RCDSRVVSRGIEQAKAYKASFDAARARSLAQCQARLAAADRKNREEMYHRKSELKAAEDSIANAKAWQDFLAKGEAEVFAYYRAWEAEVARGLKLKEVWEPSPFPAEPPAAQHTAETSDPIFPPTPWLEFPTTWRQDPPEAPGEIRFGRDWWHKQGRVALLHPISPEQGERDH